MPSDKLQFIKVDVEITVIDSWIDDDVARGSNPMTANVLYEMKLGKPFNTTTLRLFTAEVE